MAKSQSGRIPSVRETAAAFAVLALLGCVLAWLLAVQSHFSPAVTLVFSPRGADLPAVPVRAAVPDLLVAWPPAIRPMSAAEAFVPATLSDKIDGKAEVYLAAGVSGLHCQRLALIHSPGSWIEMFVFDMGKPANAFSVFSSQKRTDVADLKLADYAYRAGNEIVFVHGSNYVELVATDESSPTLAAAAELAAAYVTATPVAVHADVSKDSARFPHDGLVAGSVRLLSADVFGFDGLKDVFVARYRDGKDEFTMFIARRAGADDASAGASALRGFLVDDCGGKEVAHPALPAGAVIIDEGQSFEGVFTAGPYLLGVHQVPSRECAERWMQKLGGYVAAQP